MKTKALYKKLILASSTMLATALTLTSTTWAWFKINSKATVSFAEFEVVSGNGFWVSIDNTNFYNSLSTEQIHKAILVGYDSDAYEIKPYTNYQYVSDGTYSESQMDGLGYAKADVLYKISYSLDEDTDAYKKIYTELDGEDLENEIDKILNDKINLWPVTSTNGVDFTTLSSGKTTYKANSGYYAQFPIYFKTISTRTSDKQRYDVYLNGYSGLDAYGNTVLPTVITSNPRKIKLNAGLTTYENGEVVNYKSGDKIEVYSSNSIRISTTQQEVEDFVVTSDTLYQEGKTYYTDVDGVMTTVASSTYEIGTPITSTLYEEGDNTTYADDYSTSLIYEINDTVNGAKNLGSYATDCDVKYVVTKDSEVKTGKTYYEITYTKFTGTTFEDGVVYYEYDGTNYSKTTDTEPQAPTEYYVQSITEFSGTAFIEGNTYYEFNSDYYMYNCDTNAMYTYYNKLVSSERKLKALSYDELPNNIITELPSNYSEDLTRAITGASATSTSYMPMVTLSSGYAAKRIMFRVWLEGWDADNIDGLADPVDIRFAFSAKKISWE